MSPSDPFGSYEVDCRAKRSAFSLKWFFSRHLLQSVIGISFSHFLPLLIFCFFYRAIMVPFPLHAPKQLSIIWSCLFLFLSRRFIFLLVSVFHTVFDEGKEFSDDSRLDTCTSSPDNKDFSSQSINQCLRYIPLFPWFWPSRLRWPPVSNIAPSEKTLARNRCTIIFYRIKSMEKT